MQCVFAEMFLSHTVDLFIPDHKEHTDTRCSDYCLKCYKAVTRIFFGGGCHVELERRRREDRGAVSPPQKSFAFLFQNGGFLCMPAWTSVWYFFAEQIDKVG